MYNGNMFTCTKCKKSYNTEAGWKGHHCNKCKQCEKTFSSHQRLKSHFCDGKSNTSEVHKCEKCKRVFKTFARLHIHKCTFCEFCEKTYSTIQRYKDHRCDMAFDLTVDKEKKQISDVNKTHKCNVDRISTTQTVCTSNNESADRVQDIFERTDCSDPDGSGEFKALEDIENTVPRIETHEITNHSLKFNYCEFCKKKFKTLKGLKQHKCSYCKRCMKRYSTYQKLMMHKCVNTEQILFSGNKKHLNINMVSESYNSTESDKCIRSTNLKTAKSSDPQFPDLGFKKNSNVTSLIQKECSRKNFNPVSLQWQLEKCNEMKLPLVVGHSFTKSSLEKPCSVYETRQDGNCFFRAISYIVTGKECFHSDIRAKVILHMQTYPDIVKSVLPADETVDTYLETTQMARSQTWATHIEIFVTAHLLKTNIYVYTKYGNKMQWTKHGASFLQSSVTPESCDIYLDHPGQVHYNVVTSVFCDTLQTKDVVSNSSDIMTDMIMKELQFQVNLSKVHLASTAAQPADNTISSDRKKRHRQQMQALRADKNYRNEEKLKNQARKRQQRKDKIYRQKENAAKHKSNNYLNQARLHKCKKRRQLSYTLKEKLSRMTAQYRNKQKLYKKALRTNLNQRLKEKRGKLKPKYREKMKEYKKVQRMNPEKRLKEKLGKMTDKYREKMRQYMKAQRMNPEQRHNEKLGKMTDKYREKMRQHMKAQRMSPEQRLKEKLGKMTENYREKMKQYMKRQRVGNEFRLKENQTRLLDHCRERMKLYMRRRRVTLQVNRLKVVGRSRKYKEMDRVRKQIQRENLQYLECQLMYIQHKREDIKYVLKERLHKRKKRKDRSYRSHEKDNKQKEISEQSVISSFHDSVQEGPIFVCTCCSQLWYRQSVRYADSVKNITAEDHIKKCFRGIVSAKGKEWLCNTCESALRKKRLPALSVANKVYFPERPKILNLGNLEERLVAPRIPFMQLHELPRGGQLSLKGNMVNIPTNINTIASVLPRQADDSASIPLKLKRRLSYQQHYMYNTVRPNVVLDALKYLVENSPLFKNEGIMIDKDWEYRPIDDFTEETKNSEKDEKPADSNKNSENDVWDENSLEDLSAGNLDTMLQPSDMSEEARRVVSVAPGEGGFPVSVFMDKYSEELSFPSLFCGVPRPENCHREVPVYYSELCKSELRNKDRRIAGHIANIFFKMKKLQMKQILDRASLCLRKTKNISNVTAGMLKSKEKIDTIVNVDEGFRVFRDLRGSPPYWERVKKDLFAMLRQLGIPTWFASFSAAETKWDHLLQILGHTVDNKHYSSEEVSRMTWFDKQRLISKDPVTCARHFDFQVQKFIYTVLKSSLCPVGLISDFFYKVEFQMRGSPHIHMLIWVEGAPALNEYNVEAVIEFIDKYVTCAKEDDVNDLIDRQQHRHSRTCQKKKKNKCRFNFPQPPLSKTQILDPLPPDCAENEVRKHKQSWKSIQNALDTYKNGETLEFNQFLQKLSLTEEEYILAIRSSIKTKTIFLKRSLDETRINNYNKVLLLSWRANMDLQFVVDPFACAMYVVTYVAKSQRGMSNLLYCACKEAQEGNFDIRRQVQHIGNVFLNNVEISAQEAVYFILQIPLYKSSRDVLFINTSPPNERTVMLKTFQQIQALPNDSTEIEQHGVIQHYTERPKQLEDICLADYVSQYRKVKKSAEKIVEATENDNDEASEQTDEEKEPAEVNIFSLGNGYVLRKRKKPAAIRYVHYHEDKDREKHYREILMLFLPWRDEDTLMAECETYEERYFHIIKETLDLTEKMKQYNHHSKTLELAIKAAESMNESDFEGQWDQLAPNTEFIEQEDIDEGVRHTDKYPSLRQIEKSDLGYDLGLRVKNTTDEEVVVNMLTDDKYFDMARSLNPEQRHVFYQVLHWLKTKSEPLYLFITGGAGVGKTVVVTVLYQALLRFYNKGVDIDPDDLKVLLAAPTGKAAYLIKGNTIHNLFAIPASQGFTYKTLTQDRLNTLRCKFKQVKLLIIDEVSMVGNQMLNFINLRLQQIMGSSKPFGGLSVVVVGDLYQLKPVFDGWIFYNLRSDYGPLATNLWKELFYFYQLDTIMRQRDDLEFAKLLNRLRVGHQTKEDIELLKTREIKVDMLNAKYPREIPHIFLKNDLVNSHNGMVFAMAPESTKAVVHAIDIVVGDVSAEVKEKLLKIVPNDSSKTMGLVALLQTALDLRVEISSNVDVEDGIANGASGVLKAVTGRVGDNDRPLYFWVSFDDQRIGTNMRRISKQLYQKNILPNWTPIAEVKRQFNIGNHKSAQILRSQFPLRPACAKTAHRCQGDTLNSAVIDLSGRTFPHAHYVCLSRVRNLSNLHIKALNSESISVSKPVHDEMARLEKERKLVCCLQSLNEVKAKLKIIYHNVRSLHKHFLDVLSDNSYHSADLCIFTESRLNHLDNDNNLNIPGFKIYRYDHSFRTRTGMNRSPYGMVIYSKVSLEVIDISHQLLLNSSGTVTEYVLIHIKTDDANGLAVIGVYVSPQAKVPELESAVNNINNRLIALNPSYTIIMGDFNVDLLKVSGSSVKKIFPSKMQFILSETTDYHSALDHIYSDVPMSHLRIGVMESYFSDHKPVWAAIM